MMEKSKEYSKYLERLNQMKNEKSQYIQDEDNYYDNNHKAWKKKPFKVISWEPINTIDDERERLAKVALARAFIPWKPWRDEVREANRDLSMTALYTRIFEKHTFSEPDPC